MFGRKKKDKTVPEQIAQRFEDIYATNPVDDKASMAYIRQRMITGKLRDLSREILTVEIRIKPSGDLFRISKGINGVKKITAVEDCCVYVTNDDDTLSTTKFDPNEVLMLYIKRIKPIEDLNTLIDQLPDNLKKDVIEGKDYNNAYH